VTSGRFLEAELRARLGDPSLRIVSIEPVSGGCIHETARVETTKGDFFAKWNSEAPAEIFSSEAEGLRLLRAAASGLVVPEVLLAAPSRDGRPAFIVMEYLPPASGRGAKAHEALGRGLADVHRQSADAFGFPVTTYCGPTPQDNAWTSSWVEFYAERRVRALVRLLEKQGQVGPTERGILDRLADRLPALLPHETVPALIHGDLWSGNVLHTEQGPALVDPACTYADREMEFGITTLFGGLSDRAWSAYLEAAPLESGWRDRTPVYQLYHLLNHHLLFGGGYGAQALAIARRYV
jgi:fructosamine-3-kinase